MYRCNKLQTSDSDSGARIVGNLNGHHSGNVYMVHQSESTVSDYHGRDSRVRNGLHPDSSGKTTDLIVKIGVHLKNLGSSDAHRIPDLLGSDIGCTILSRDYKGLSNYASNGVLEIYKRTNRECD